MMSELVPPGGDHGGVQADSELVAPVVRLPLDVRSLSLSILAAIAVVFALEWAQAFLISLLLGVLVAYTLNPPVTWLERIRIPRIAASLIVMVAAMGAFALGAYSIRGQMQAVVTQLPEATSKFAAGLSRLRTSQIGPLLKMQSASTAVEKATSQLTNPSPVTGQRETRVVIDQAGFKFGDFLWAGSKGAVGGAGQALMVLFLAFFLLAAGDTFKRKLVRLAGPSLASKKITVRILDDINHSIQKYLSMMLLTNVMVGVLAWAAFAAMDLDNAGAWAVAAGLLHVVPYLGPAVTAVATGMAAFVQFDSFPMAMLVCGVSLTIATLIGTFVTTWLTGRIARLNPAAVFISLLFWGWLWGIWGMLLGIPILVIVKVVSQHLEQLQPVAELLGE
jgi:predicted PurR-regulated permease PerM